MILASVLAVASCSGKFVANGTVEGDKGKAEGAYVALVVNGDTEVAVSDIKDGRFSLSAKADPTKFGMLVVKDSKDEEYDYSSGYMVSVIPDKAKVEVVLSEDASTAEGSPLTDALKEYQDKLYNTYYGAQEAIAKVMEEGGDEAELEALSKNRDKAIIDLSKEAYEANSNNAVGLQAIYMLLQTDSDLTIDELKSLVAKGGDFIRNEESVNGILQRKEKAEATKAGSKFKDIEGKTADGKTVKLSDFAGKGRYVLCDFWASWCGPCMNAVPKVRALLAKYENQGLDLVGINCWERDPEKGPAKAREMDMTWPVIFAEDEAVDVYGVEAIPTLILISPDGKILERIVGDSGIEEALAKYFE